MKRSSLISGAIAVFLAAIISWGAYRFVVNSDSYLSGVGRIPGGDFNTLVTLPDGIDVTFPELIGKMIGPQIQGNRVLMIGDSIFASTSSRYGNEMCNTLTQLGWQVAVEAQAGEFIDFGSRVLGRRWEEGWDTAVVFLGTNFDGNIVRYEEKLREMFDVLSQNPFVVLTTAEFRPKQLEVNEVIKRLAEEYGNVSVLDWAAVASNNGLIGRDGVHLTADGRAVLATAVARSLEFSRDRTNGQCLKPVFRDDSKVLDAMPTTVADETVTTDAVDDGGATTVVP
ncbi:MAG: SGNH/GDSL hydrolase family protein [Actinobacteria bacterium]|jgi:hypothetical protein|nr:MAG: hypothetical protein ABR57_03935 [Acidimicrobium sp. BACL17 MAG-120924-bin0]KRO42751.1 MAG: hypothetical protein ABR67_05335 [Acidimicrobium sp. BACL17 MAG-120823-bin42]MDA0193225.1 SGNH/GDSL hydrolase family protein [Actinomycetota bacterium]MDA2952856.1 SGNH/GDSL hydrolase family protein [Actinomycetota bacterium]MDA2998832.1 SGNH/GDSL hydrolase family protein [Actinomycetota bacterium]